ncbi:MAG: ATP-binding protein [Prolixibacteraceae bacterium]
MRFNLFSIYKSGENETLEFKSSFNNELIETLVVFANTTGGKIIAGINSKGEVTGTSLNAESIQNWVNEIKNKTSPSLIPDVESIQTDNKTIVVFSMQEYPIKRVANSNHLLDISEVVNLHLQSFNTSWDFHVNNQFKINDISLGKVQTAIDQVNKTGARISDDPLTFCIKNDLIRDGQITNAAYLLFTERDTVITTIELGKFQTDTVMKDSDRTKSDILTQIEQVISFVKKHINKEIIITGQPRNTEKWQYPLEAIREIVINMIIHRDYRSASDSIVKIFDDRIEFYNPGKLPDSITEDDLLSNNYKSTPRNKLIADFCKSLGLIEKYGSGIRRIIEYFKDANMPQPEFRNISDGFMVTAFVAESTTKVGEKLTANQKTIVSHMQNNPYITAKELSKKVGISVRKIETNIKKLKDLDYIKRIGPPKGGQWEIINK